MCLHSSWRTPAPYALVASLILLVFVYPAGGYDVVSIGDSWAGFIANGAPGSEMDTGTGNALQTIFDQNGSGKTVYNGAFYGGTAEDHLGEFNNIITRINLSGADIVYLSSGGNDLLAGKYDGGMYLDHPDPEGLLDRVAGRVALLAQQILDIRPDIQVVIGGYDLVNMWDFDPSDEGLGRLLRANYGLGLDGTGQLKLDDPLYPTYLEDIYRPQQDEFGQFLRGFEQRRMAIGADSRRVHFVRNLNVNNQACGYDGIFGTISAGLPRSDYDDYPVTLERSYNDGQDPIHLDTTGYELLSQNCYDEFFSTAFQDGALDLDKSSVEYGAVLVGRDASTAVTASNAGANFTKIGVRFGQPAAPFATNAGDETAYLFQDPTLGSDTLEATCTFAPAARGAFTTTVAVEVEDGDNGSVTLSGTGVAPVNRVVAENDVRVRVGTSGTLNVEVANIGDGNLSGLGEESNLHGNLSVEEGSGFGATSLPVVSLGDGETTDVTVPFAPMARGLMTAFAEVRFVDGRRDGTNAPDVYDVPLQAYGVGPVFSAGTRVSLGAVEIAAAGYESFQVSNVTDDADGGDCELTRLTLLDAFITGEDADVFDLVGFTPGLTLDKGCLTSGLEIHAFNDGTDWGAKSATLTFVTDVGATVGQVGSSYEIALSAVFVPEPSAVVLLVMLGGWVCDKTRSS